MNVFRRDVFLQYFLFIMTPAALRLTAKHSSIALLCGVLLTFSNLLFHESCAGKREREGYHESEMCSQLKAMRKLFLSPYSSLFPLYLEIFTSSDSNFIWVSFHSVFGDRILWRRVKDLNLYLNKHTWMRKERSNAFPLPAFRMKKLKWCALVELGFRAKVFVEGETIFSSFSNVCHHTTYWISRLYQGYRYIRAFSSVSYRDSAFGEERIGSGRGRSISVS